MNQRDFTLCEPDQGHLIDPIAVDIVFHNLDELLWTDPTSQCISVFRLSIWR